MKVRATGPSIVRIGVDPVRFMALTHSDREHIIYHLDRVLSGEASATMEWEHYGMKVDVISWKRV